MPPAPGTLDDEDCNCGEETSMEELMVDTPQSMFLSGDQNNIMRMPNFGSFINQQEHLQSLLVDIHDDPQGFISFVENRRESFADIEKTPIATMGSEKGHLSDYINFRRVGQGRFSSVFYAETKVGGFPRAIKRIHLGDKQDSCLRQQQGKHGAYAGGGVGGKERCRKNGMTYEHCLKEVGLLRNLTSPNIVKLDTCFLDNNVVWVVMEWIDGGDLKGVITRAREAGERLDEITIWGYFTQICDALLHMHSQRIMHRDLKPANILVCMDGTVKLGDLGLGRYLHTRSALAMSQVGTPLYMSPETLQGQGHELVSDIWSLGCVLYELAMLTSPFYARHLTMDKLFTKIVNADFLPVDRNLYSERLSNLVDHLLMPDPNTRPKIDMVQPASHLALQAQRSGIQGVDMEQLTICAGKMYPSSDGGGSEARGVGYGVDSNLPLPPKSPTGGCPSAESGDSGGASLVHTSSSSSKRLKNEKLVKYSAYSGEGDSESLPDAEHGSRGHVRSRYVEGRMKMAGADRAHGRSPPVLTRDVGVHPSPMDVPHRNTKASRDNRSSGGGVLMTGGRSPFVGEKRSLAHSASLKLDGESSYDGMATGVSRRHSFFSRNRESKK